jgi:hypothetical protein
MSLRKLLSELFDRDFEDIERIVNAFPSALRGDVREVVKVLPFSERTLLLAHGSVRHEGSFVSEYQPQVLIVAGEEIKVPSRIYLNEPNEAVLERLSLRQKSVLNCIYLRHHNGYVRQKHLKQLRGESESFVCPFTVQLLGEYVIEVLEDLDGVIEQPVTASYIDFLEQNAFYWKQTQSRMVSYWNEYYRSDFPSIKDYIGKRLVDRLNEALRSPESRSRKA